MLFSNKIHNRRSIRLPDYDYSKPGTYFVTLCVRNRECLFGTVIDNKMVLNEAGQWVKKCWADIPVHFPFVRTDEFIIMPNHIHGILLLCDIHVGAKNLSPLQNFTRKSGTSKTIGSVIRGFKIGVTKWFRKSLPHAFVWQRNYYDHIGRNEKELFRIRDYIRFNPINWDSDEENPLNKSPRYIAMPNPQR